MSSLSPEELLLSAGFTFAGTEDSNDTALQHAFGTKGKSFRETIKSHPQGSTWLKDFSLLFMVWADGSTQLEDAYPVERQLGAQFDASPPNVMFVDVGGGLGQKTIRLKQSFPALPGRFIVQDTSDRIAEAKALDGKDGVSYTDIELTAHDFSTEQPVKGARCYYIRDCLHDWQDRECVTILRHLKDAGKPGYSRILIHEVVVPNTGAGAWVVSKDIHMMSIFATGERTEAQWHELCSKAGLKVSRVYWGSGPRYECILEINI